MSKLIEARTDFGLRLDKVRGGEETVLNSLQNYYDFLPLVPQLLFLHGRSYNNLLSILFPAEALESAAISHHRQ